MGYSYALSHTRIKHTTLLSNKDFTYSFNNTTPQIGMWMYTVEWIPCQKSLFVHETCWLYNCIIFRGVDQALLFSQFCSFRPDNGLNIFCCELTSTVQTLGALIIMESFDDDVYSMRARTQCVPLKLLVCTFFLSSLIATHSCKCFLRVFAISREASIQTYWCPSKDKPLHATVSFQKAKKKPNFYLGRN